MVTRGRGGTRVAVSAALDPGRLCIPDRSTLGFRPGYPAARVFPDSSGASGRESGQGLLGGPVT
jgi:hypothetical protein